jgi:hypothetical protein
MTNKNEVTVNGPHMPNPTHVSLPRPSLWPLVLAMGVTLAAGGLISTRILTIVGGALALAGIIGWFFQVLPRDRHEDVPVLSKPVEIAKSNRKVARMAAAAAQPQHRARLPLEIYPISAGIKGGLAGSVAMAVAAIFYGLISHGSVWYPINLLGAVVYAQTEFTTAWISSFHIELLLVAIALHLTTSILVGLLYGAILPMLPRHPILLGGVFAPIVWTGLLHSVLDIIDPLLNRRIDWFWFLISQVAFGIVAGIVVLRQVRIPVWQYPLATRAGLESPGIMDETSQRPPA